MQTVELGKGVRRHLTALISFFLLNFFDIMSTSYALKLGCKELNPFYSGQNLMNKAVLPFVFGLLYVSALKLARKEREERVETALTYILFLIVGFYVFVVINNLTAIVSAML